MRKKSKLTLALAVCSVSAAFAGLALSNTTVQATEETPVATFAMEKGAAVRAVEDQAGIRWTTNVNSTWVTENLTNATEVQFGTLVTAASKVDSVTELTVENYEAETKEIIDLPCDMEKFDYTSNTTSTYYSSIVYDNMSTWTTEKKNQAYATELIARSYVKYKDKDGKPQCVYATSNNNQRCMRLVAVLAYYETDETKKLTDKQKGYVDDYFIKPEGDTLPTVDFGGYYETAIGKTNSAYTAAYYDGKQVGKADENNTLWVTLGNLGTKNYIIYLFDDAGNCARTDVFRNITAVLTQENFATYMNVSGDIAGYYVLGSPIDLGGTYYGKTNTFMGTLDGKGFTISGIALTGGTEANNKGGLFQYLKGTIKNVSIVGNVEKKGGLITDLCNAEATIEDVYVSASLLQSESGAIARWIRNGADITMKNVVVEMVKTSTGKPGALFGYADKPGNLSITLTLENCYYITTTGLGPIDGNSNNYITMTDGGDETVFGTKTTETVDTTTVTTYANGLTGYTADDLDTAKAVFAGAVTENSDMISDTLKELLLKANA